jgi:hypothetical protein
MDVAIVLWSAVIVGYAACTWKLVRTGRAAPAAGGRPERTAATRAALRPVSARGEAASNAGLPARGSARTDRAG